MKVKRCPKCSAPMYRRRVAEVEIDGCPECGGVWLDRGELEALMSHGREVLLEVEKQVVAAGQVTENDTPLCPLCTNPMGPARGADLERAAALECPACNGLWFDDKALAALVGPPAVEAAPDAELNDRRSFYIGDRVTYTQAAFLLVTALLVTLLEATGRSAQFADSGLLIAIIVALVAVALLYFGRRKLYMEKPLWVTGLLYLAIWAPLTTWGGVEADEHYGHGNALVVSVVVAVMNLIGYHLARHLRKGRHAKAGRSRKFEVIALVALLLIVPALVGIEVFRRGILTCELGPEWTFAAAKQCQTCLVGIYIVLLGVGAAISMGINYFMLHCLFDPKGLDVVENPPGELYLKMMIGGLIVTGVAWTLLLVLLPPVAGGGGGGGKKSGSSSRRSGHSGRAYATRGSGMTAAELEEQQRRMVQEKWAKLGLHAVRKI